MKKANSNILIFILLLFGLLTLTLPMILYHIFNEPVASNVNNLLSFYGSIFGSILGAFATIVAVYFTIKQNKTQMEEERIYNKNQMAEERILSSKPYLQSIYESYNSIRTDAFVDMVVFYINFDLKSKDITNEKTIFPNMEINMYNESVLNDTETEQSKTLYEFKYILENVGAGHAINIVMTINGYYVIPQFTVPLNKRQVFIIRIFSVKTKEGNEEYVNIQLRYSDAASIMVYEQIDELYIFFDNVSKTLISRRIQPITPPHELPDFAVSDLQKQAMP